MKDEKYFICAQNRIDPARSGGPANRLAWTYSFRILDLSQATAYHICRTGNPHRELLFSVLPVSTRTWVGAVFDDLCEYHHKNFEPCSRLMRMTFDEALSYFSDGSIDLLHIDGLHTYEAIKHDFTSWLHRLSQRSVVVFHDMNVRERCFGVWKLWADLCKKYPYIDFEHSHGLGVLFVSQHIPTEIQDMLQTYETDPLTVKTLFAFLGQRIGQQYELTSLTQDVAHHDSDVSNLFLAVNECDAQIAAYGEIIQKIYYSHSWRLTGPLRFLARWLSGQLKN